MKTLTGAQVAELVGAPVSRELANIPVKRVSSIEAADSEAVVFAADERSLAAALASKAGLILATAGCIAAEDTRLLLVHAPKFAFALTAREMKAARRAQRMIHATASVDVMAELGRGVVIGARAVVEAGVTLGDDVTIGAGALILGGTSVGDRCVIQAGAVLGSTGFGYVRDRATGEYLLFPQQGTLILEADVEIGANTTIDRGALGETRIGKGTKIDNLVQVGHNCTIGKDVIIASQVGISGSTIVEDGVILAGQVGLGDHVRIGKGVVLGGQAGVFPGKSVEGPGEMYAGTPAEPVRDYLKSMARVRRLK